LNKGQQKTTFQTYEHAVMLCVKTNGQKRKSDLSRSLVFILVNKLCMTIKSTLEAILEEQSKTKFLAKVNRTFKATFFSIRYKLLNF